MIDCEKWAVNSSRNRRPPSGPPGSKTGFRFRFLLSIVLGWVMVPTGMRVGMIVVNALHVSLGTSPRGQGAELVVMLAFGAFVGGLASGWAMWDVVWFRRGRFYLLVVASPASLAWVAGIVMAVESRGHGMETEPLLAFVVFCIAGVAGSLSGYRIGWWKEAHRRRRRKDLERSTSLGEERTTAPEDESAAEAPDD